MIVFMKSSRSPGAMAVSVSNNCPAAVASIGTPVFSIQSIIPPSAVEIPERRPGSMSLTPEMKVPVHWRTAFAMTGIWPESQPAKLVINTERDASA